MTVRKSIDRMIIDEGSEGLCVMALCVKRSKILSKGISQFKGDHAEVDAINNLKVKPALGSIDLIVYRFRMSNGVRSLGISKPCIRCIKHIKHTRFIRNIIYFDQQGQMQKNNINDTTFDECILSSFDRYIYNQRQIMN